MRCGTCKYLQSMVLALVISIGVSGCAAGIMVAVGAGAVGGYAVSRDSVEGVSAKSQDELWDAAQRVASIMGNIDDSDRRRSQIAARINGANVDITILPVNLTNTKLRIKARKGIFPSIGVAQEVYAKILNQLEE